LINPWRRLTFLRSAFVYRCAAHNPDAKLRGAFPSLFLLRFFVAAVASDARAAGQKPVSGAVVRN
jgi:hypothetical protein